MRAQLRLSLALSVGSAASLLACEAPPAGGVTASLKIRDDLLRSQHALRESSLVGEINRLEIAVYDTDGSTLAVTNLRDTGTGEELLSREGGRWTLKEVPAGSGRILRARAYLSIPGSPWDGQVGFDGEKRNLTVEPGQVTSAGLIELLPKPGLRIPSLDTTPPGSPGGLLLQAQPQGEALLASWTPPSDPDLAGYVVAISSSLTASAAIPRNQRSLAVGTDLSPGVKVAAWLTSPNASSAMITGLTDGTPVKVFVFAYDEGLLPGQGLNYSGPASQTATPSDTTPPGGFPMLAVQAMDLTTAAVVFTGPGEDGAVGTPDHYDVRSATVSSILMNPSEFALLPQIAAPPVVAGGTVGMYSRSFSGLGRVGSEPFFLGMRAVDAAGNVGPITVAAYTVGATLTPTINALEPEIALASAGSTLRIQGTLFGTRTGTVTLRARTSTTLRVLSWSDSEVVVNVPPSAESGTLTLVRARDARIVTTYVAVIARLPETIGAATLPFQLVSAPLPGFDSVHALYDGRPAGTVQHAIRRIFTEIFENLPFVPLLTNAAATALAGTYSSVLDRFLFIEALDLGLTVAAVSTSTLSAAPQRTLVSTASAADGVGIAVLTGTIAPAGVPAMVAFSSGGRVRTASTSNIMGGLINRFFDLGVSDASGVQILRGVDALDSDAFVMAYRVGTGTTARLTARTATIAVLPGGWAAEIPGPSADRFVLLDVPAVGFVVVYEAIDVNTRHEVRVLPLSSFGLGPGYAPFAAQASERRLEDAGLVRRGGRTFISLATSLQSGANQELSYAELDPTNIAASGTGTLRGVTLETVIGATAGARLGCKPVAVERCPLIWAGPRITGAAFVRR